ncbi:hypothetical protein HK101_000552 [Irineochytrium annulatum]|nr:hypothetical protein HK101_000552 [Irineochytrium annulatum]
MPEANKGCTSPPQAPKRLRSNSDVVRGSNSNANPATPAATAKTTSPTATPRRTASNSLPNTTAARRPGGLRRPDAPRGAKLVWADDAGSVLEVHHGFDDYLDRVLLLREERRRAEERRRKEEGGKDGRGFFEILSTGAAVPYSFG